MRLGPSHSSPLFSSSSARTVDSRVVVIKPALQARSEWGSTGSIEPPLPPAASSTVTVVVLAVNCLAFLLIYTTEFAPKWAISSEKVPKFSGEPLSKPLLQWGGGTGTPPPHTPVPRRLDLTPLEMSGYGLHSVWKSDRCTWIFFSCDQVMLQKQWFTTDWVVVVGLKVSRLIYEVIVILSL